MNENEILKISVGKKMNVIISLLMKISNTGKEESLKDQVKLLGSFGLESSEIAEILGKTVGYVSKELSILKKNNK